MKLALALLFIFEFALWAPLHGNIDSLKELQKKTYLHPADGIGHF